MLSLSDVLSAIAIVVAGLALLQASQTQRENKRLQERMLWIEEARERDRLIEAKTAKLIAKIWRGTILGEPSRLVIKNGGQSEARDIEIFINGEPIAFYGGVNYRPMSVVPAEESFSFRVNDTGDLPDHFRVRMTWTDNSGEPGLFEATLPI